VVRFSLQLLPGQSCDELVLDDGAVDFAGDFYRSSGVFSAARAVQEHLPIKIGAMGAPRSMQLAGKIADGMFTACAYSPATRSRAERDLEPSVRAFAGSTGRVRRDCPQGQLVPAKSRTPG
jgi:alkanesulfonate monooxygenase SsuD/methylene tetrahydromethanopterin reductase-like flavin-dependent oxidoreductase (luciferase family)